MILILFALVIILFEKGFVVAAAELIREIVRLLSPAKALEF